MFTPKNQSNIIQKITPQKKTYINEIKEIEIDTKEKVNKCETHAKKEEMEINIKKEEEMEQEDDLMKINIEKELEKIELKNHIVIRLLETNCIKYVDFCKFYKGYPTKKSIRIDLETYKKINEYLNKY